MDEPVPNEAARITQGLVTGVEQPQLHQLVGLHVGNDLHAGVFEWRAAAGEAVFEYPLREGLAEHGPLILDPEPAAELGAVGVGGTGRDPVDHAVGEPDVAGHPLGQAGITPAGERRERALAHVAVARDVVTGHDGGGRDAPCAAAGERFGHYPENCSWYRSWLQVSHDRGI